MKNRKRLILIPIGVLFIFAGVYIFRTTPLVKNNGSRLRQQITRTTERLNAEKTTRHKAKKGTQSEDPWEICLEEQVEANIQGLLREFAKKYPAAQPLSELTLEMIRDDIRVKLRAELHKFKKEYDTPPDITSTSKVKTLPLPRYEGPQTTEAILEEFAEKYNKTWEKPEIAEKYPQAEWIRMLLDRGIAIEDSGDFFWYQEPRRALTRLENEPGAWASGAFGIPPTDDWETYKDAYIERRLWEHQLIRKAMKADPEVAGGIFVGKNQEIFHPTKSNRIYVERKHAGASFYGGRLTEVQKFEILFKGITPEHYEIVYLNEEGNILEVPPPLITREEVLNTGGTPPPEEWWDGEESQQETPDFDMDTFIQDVPLPDTRNLPNAPADLYPDPHLEFKQARQETENVLEHLTKSDADIQAELEKQFLPELPSEEDFEKALRQRFSPERFNRALSTLNQYGPEEGLRKLKESDPEVAAHIERKIKRPE